MLSPPRARMLYMSPACLSLLALDTQRAVECVHRLQATLLALRCCASQPCFKRVQWREDQAPHLIVAPE